MELKTRNRIIPVAILCLITFFACGKNNERQFTLLQWNIWQEGTMVSGGYDAIVNEIARLQPDFVTFSEVRNYNYTRFNERIVASLKEKGLIYYSFYSYDSGLLSKYPIIDSTTIFPEKEDHGSIYKMTVSLHGRTLAIYTAHLDYLNCAYYNVYGYDGSTWKETSKPLSADEVIRLNNLSQRDNAIKAFIKAAKEDLSNGYDVIIGGDFNEPSHLDWIDATSYIHNHNGLTVSWTVTKLCDEAGFIDAYRHINPNPVTHPGFTYPSDNEHASIQKLTWAPKADERERIDYVFYQGKNIEAKQAAIFGPNSSIVRSERLPETSQDVFIEPLDVWPTDHKGVLITFGIKRE